MKVEITEDMALNGDFCPVCKRLFISNGVGGKGNFLTPIIDNLPSSSALRYGCKFHDWCYHLADNWGTRLEADKLMLAKNKWFIEKYCTGLQKYFYHAANYRNYIAVRIFGRKFWDQEDCREVESANFG